MLFLKSLSTYIAKHNKQTVIVYKIYLTLNSKLITANNTNELSFVISLYNT